MIRQVSARAPLLRWGLVGVLLLAPVLVPFALFGEAFEAWAAALIRSEQGAAAAAVIGVALLAADVLLPVPSSLVSAVLGAVLGPLAGAAASAVGMSLGFAVGYGLGRAAGSGGVERLLGPREAGLPALLAGRRGLIVLAACRAVPVLAEASAIAAGLARVPAGPALLVTTAANLGVGAVYALVGASIGDAAAFAAAFAAALALSGLGLLVTGALRRPPPRGP